MSGDFIGYCVACGCHVEEEPDQGDGYVHTIEEKYQIFGRFANWMQQMKFRNGAWTYENPTFKTEAPFFFTLRGHCSRGGPLARLRCGNSVPRATAEKILYERDSAGNWTFPIHDCCLTVLDRACEWSQKKTFVISRENFYNAVCQQADRNDRARHSKPEEQGTRRSGVMWEHGYYGAQRCQIGRWVGIENNPLGIGDLSSYLRLHLGLIIHGPPQQPFASPPPPEPPFQQVPIWCHDRVTIQSPSINERTNETSTLRTTATIPQFRHEAHQTVLPLLWPQSVVHVEHGLSICMSATGDPRRVLGAPIPPTCPHPELPHNTTADAGSPTDPEHLAPFLTMPTEILDLILANLSPRSLVSLHDCCKTFAARLPLDQRFWRDGLLSNRLLGFTWDLDDVMSEDEILQKRNSDDALGWDWKGLGQVLGREAFYRGEEEGVFEDPGIPDGLKARKRIWRCIVEIARSRKGDT